MGESIKNYSPETTNQPITPEKADKIMKGREEMKEIQNKEEANKLADDIIKEINPETIQKTFQTLQYIMKQENYNKLGPEQKKVIDNITNSINTAWCNYYGMEELFGMYNDPQEIAQKANEIISDPTSLEKTRQFLLQEMENAPKNLGEIIEPIQKDIENQINQAGIIIQNQA